jgi:hypothetical protein
VCPNKAATTALRRVLAARDAKEAVVILPQPLPKFWGCRLDSRPLSSLDSPCREQKAGAAIPIIRFSSATASHFANGAIDYEDLPFL